MDPLEEYLATKAAPAGDDPLAAYLDSKQGDRRARLEAKHKANVKELRQLRANPENTFGDYVNAAGGALGEKLAGMGRGALAVGEYGAHAARHPLDTVSALWRDDLPEEDARRRQLVRGVADVTTLGYGNQLADYIASRTGGTTLAASEAADAQVAPDLRTGGQLVGSFLPGAVNAIGRGAGAVAGKLAPSAGAIGGAARAGLGYELAAPAISGLHAESAGNRAGAALDAATDPANLALAVGAGAAGGAVSDRISRSKGAAARRLIEEKGRGARVGLTTPGTGGVFADELAGVPANDKGIGQAARIGAEKITRGLKEQHRVEVSRPYQVMKGMIDNSPEAARLRDVSPIVTSMQDAIWDLETAPQARAQLQEQMGLLERHRENPADPDSAIMVPERQLNGLRRTLMRAAKVGATDAPGEKEAPLRAAAFAAKQMVDEGPYAPLNEFYAEGAQKLTKSRRQLGLKPKAPSDANVDTKKVKLSLEREGQNTKTAGGDADLDAFRADHPELAGQADLAELARARAELAFHFAPQHGGLIERTAGAALGPGAAIGAAALGHGPMGLLGAAGILAAQNATPIAGRILYPLAGAGGGATNRILAAYEAERERNRRRAALARRTAP